MKKGIIFDMDGTLWDSVDNIVYSWNAALRELRETDNRYMEKSVSMYHSGIKDEKGQASTTQAESDIPSHIPTNEQSTVSGNFKTPAITRESLLSLMGNTMDVFVRELLPDLPPEKANEWMDIMMRLENDYLREHGAVLLGDVAGVFARLHEMDYGVYIVSNCQSGYIEAFMEYYHLEALVDDIECYGNTLHGKADNLRLLIERNALTEYLYLGDTQGDFNACKQAGVPFLFAAYGFGSVNADVPKIQELDDLPMYLKSNSSLKNH